MQLNQGVGGMNKRMMMGFRFDGDDVIIGIFSKPCNFAIFEGRSSEFGKLGRLDMLIKVSAFHKYYFIC